MVEKEGVDGMLGMMIGVIQGGIRIMTSKQKVSSSSKSKTTLFAATHYPIHHTLRTESCLTAAAATR